MVPGKLGASGATPAASASTSEAPRPPPPPQSTAPLPPKPAALGAAPPEGAALLLLAEPAVSMAAPEPRLATEPRPSALPEEATAGPHPVLARLPPPAPLLPSVPQALPEAAAPHPSSMAPRPRRSSSCSGGTAATAAAAAGATAGVARPEARHGAGARSASTPPLLPPSQGEAQAAGPVPGSRRRQASPHARAADGPGSMNFPAQLRRMSSSSSKFSAARDETTILTGRQASPLARRPQSLGPGTSMEAPVRRLRRASSSLSRMSADCQQMGASSRPGTAEDQGVDTLILDSAARLASSRSREGLGSQLRSASSSSIADEIPEHDSEQVSWGSASASQPSQGRRSPALSPLGTTQRHMQNRKPRGLRNLGNTCFLNAALQALAHAPLLAPFFLQGQFVRDLNAANPLGTGGVLASAFANLLQQLHPSAAEGTGGHQAASAFAPEEFYATICKIFPLVGEQPGAQQDAQEVLAFLLDALHEDLNRAREKPPYEERPDPKESDLCRKGEERYAAEAWHDHLRRHRSVLVDLFQGQLRSQVRCCECGCCSVKYDPFLFLTLPMPQGLKRGVREPIEEAFHAFCTEERLEMDNRWGCPRCARRVSALKRLSLWKLPMLLLIHFKRFGFEANSSWDVAPRAWKIEGEVTVPMCRFDLQRFVADTSPQRVPLQYDLFAAVDHVGATPFVGHYTAACRRADGWWRFDDSHAEFLGSAEATDSSNVLGEGNYLLFFQRRDAPPEPDLVREQSHRKPENWPHVKGDGVEWSFLPEGSCSQQF